MIEYILILLFMAGIFWGITYVKTKYLTKNNWKILITDCATFILFFILFIWPKISEKDTSLSIFRIILLIILSFYFVFKIFKTIKMIKNKTA